MRGLLQSQRARGWRAAALALATLMLAGVLLSGCGLHPISLISGLTHKTVAKDGGLVYTLKAQCPTGQAQCNLSATMPQEMSVLLYRCQHGLGVSDATVSRQGSNIIIVDLPAFNAGPHATTLLTKPGVLDFINTDGVQLAIGTTPPPGKYPIIFTGSDLDPNATQAEIDSQTNQPVLVFAFADSAKDRFATYTRDHIGQYLTITLDGVVIESATIQSEIDGQGQITDIGSIADVQNLAAELQSHALPLPVALISEQTVKPS